MATSEIAIHRPQRWDEPFDAQMQQATVDRLRGISPFREMDPAAFPARLPLEEILRNDTRVVEFSEGDVIFREGDYGASAFLLLHGEARIALESLEELIDDKPAAKSRNWLRSIARVLRGPGPPEVRQQITPESNQAVGTRQQAGATAVFLQDVPHVVQSTNTSPLKAGEVFGELGALTRAPRSATVFAMTKVVALEIRWQGLRDFMRYSPALRDHIHAFYRKNSLRVHLRETPLLANLSEEQLATVAAVTEFKSHGSFQWHDDLPSADDTTLFERVTREPLVAEEGQPVDGLLLVRSGFARLSHRRGEGHQTTAYLGKGQAFGAVELAHEFTHGTPQPLTQSLRAVGYLDVLHIPRQVVLETILPQAPPALVQELAAEAERLATAIAQETISIETPLPERTLDFLVDTRLMNGVEAMVIDLDRCTRCDDCVRACAATHDGNPRFIRQGPTHDHFQFTNACMHCVDPVCMIGCPTGAIHRDAETGVVKINDPTCIGCGICASSCPYHNIQMVEVRDQWGGFLVDQETRQPIVKATKCDLCVDQHGGPACQNACPHDALVRIDVAEITPLANWMQT